MQSIIRRGVLLAVYLAVVSVSVNAETWGKECSSSADCGADATCVAGDSVDAVQRCVAGTPCGGTVLGACPGDDKSGQLACIWRENPKVCYPGNPGCLNIDDKLGIYQCISLSRCDDYLGNKACSGGCNTADGKQCNGRGSCTLTGYSNSKPTFQCECQSGWNGTLCNNVVDDSCIANVGQCGTHGTCKANSCVCSSGYTGDQCQIPPANLSSSGSGTGSPSSTPKSSTPAPTSTSAQNNSASRNSDTNAITKKSGGPSALVIIMAILVALIVVGAIIFVIFARRRRRQQEAADAGGFNRTDSVVVAEGARPPTPKGKIVIM